MIIHTSFKKSKTKKKPGWRQAQEQHDAWLRKHGVHPEQVKATKSASTAELYKPTQTYRRETPQYPSRDSGGGIATKPAQQVYTGTLIKGIATMHKSNAVPVISDEQAIEISQMRRN